LQPMLQPQLPHLFQLAHQVGLTTSLDTGWDPTEQWLNNPYLAPTLAETDFFFPNEVEATALMGNGWNPQALADKVKGMVVIKRGAEGALAVSHDGAQQAIPAIPVRVVDTTGAGDAFNAGFLYATTIMKVQLVEALRFAAACGAQAVTQVGGATNAPDAAAVGAFIKQHR
jgi:ribokinase